MPDYVYDGTLEGLLTCFDLLGGFAGTGRDRILPRKAAGASRDLDLFGEALEVATRPERAEAFRHSLKTARGQEALRSIEYGFRSGSKDREEVLAAFVRALKEGKDARDLSDSRILGLRKSLERISHEAHRMLGFLRFRELENGTLYAEIEPDNDILDLLGPHFRVRFPQDRWLIRDLKRGKALAWDGKEVRLFSEAEANGDIVKDVLKKGSAEAEEGVRDLFRLYFKTIEIEERRNPALQDRFVPRRYRKHLPEFGGGGRQ